MKCQGKNKVIVIISILSIMCLSSINVFADRYLSFGWPSSNIPIQEYDYNDVWQPAMDASLSNWNNSGAGITYSKVSSSDNTVTAAQYSYSDYGRRYRTYSGSELLDYDIELNARTISEDATNFSNFVQSVFVHELGHNLWLDDNPDTTSSSIMKYSRDRNTMTNPQTYDVNSVKAKY